MQQGAPTVAWERRTDEEGNPFWVDHVHKRTSWHDPSAAAGSSNVTGDKYLPYEWWKPKSSDAEALKSGGKVVNAFAKLQAKRRAKRSRELYQARLEEGKPWAPFVATKMAVVRKMLEVTGVGPNDTVVDLGSGEGRICITAALEYGARALGVEIDPVLVEKSRANAEALGIDRQVSFECGDWLATDVSAATVVTMFFISHETINFEFMRQKFRPGTRFVSYVYPLTDWKPDAVIRTHPHMTEDGHSELYTYSIPHPAPRSRLASALRRRAAALQARRAQLLALGPVSAAAR